MDELFHSTDKKWRKKELLYKLYQKPHEKQKDMPTISKLEHGIQQADILFLPNDKGYKYLLVVVETDTRKLDAEPLKDKNNETVLEAFDTIYKRKILDMPPRTIQTDGGSEFNLAQKWFKKNGVYLRKGMPGRHRQIGVVENMNKSIGKILFMKMTADEMKKESRKWVQFLPKVIDYLNKKLNREGFKDVPVMEMPYPRVNKSNEKLLHVGTKVRIALHRPEDLRGKPLHGNFRAGDIRWKPTIFEVEGIILTPDQPPVYKVGNLQTFFTRNQLQVVDEDEILPP